MNIGIDLDETLIDFSPVFKKAFACFGLEYQKPKTWTMADYPEKVKEQIIQNFYDESIMCNLEPYPDSKYFIDFMRSKGHKVYIVTARGKFLNNEPFIKSMFDVDGIYVVEPGESKLSVLEELEIDIWIDDNPVEIEELKKTDIELVIVKNENTLYNHHVENVAEVEKVDMYLAEQIMVLDDRLNCFKKLFDV